MTLDEQIVQAFLVADDILAKQHVGKNIVGFSVSTVTDDRMPLNLVALGCANGGIVVKEYGP